MNLLTPTFASRIQELLQTKEPVAPCSQPCNVAVHSVSQEEQKLVLVLFDGCHLMDAIYAPERIPAMSKHHSSFQPGQIVKLKNYFYNTLSRCCPKRKVINGRLCIEIETYSILHSDMAIKCHGPYFDVVMPLITIEKNLFENQTLELRQRAYYFDDARPCGFDECIIPPEAEQEPRPETPVNLGEDDEDREKEEPEDFDREEQNEFMDWSSSSSSDATVPAIPLANDWRMDLMTQPQDSQELSALVPSPDPENSIIEATEESPAILMTTMPSPAPAPMRCNSPQAAFASDPDDEPSSMNNTTPVNITQETESKHTETSEEPTVSSDVPPGGMPASPQANNDGDLTEPKTPLVEDKREETSVRSSSSAKALNQMRRSLPGAQGMSKKRRLRRSLPESETKKGVFDDTTLEYARAYFYQRSETSTKSRDIFVSRRARGLYI